MVNDFVTYNQNIIIIIVTKTCAVIRLVSCAYQIDIEKLNPPIKKINGDGGGVEYYWTFLFMVARVERVEERGRIIAT